MNAVLQSDFRLAARCSRLKPSAIREILKVAGAPGVISFAGGLPAPELFPVDAIRRAAEEMMDEDGAGSMQYGLSEGYVPLREWVCRHLSETVGLRLSPDQVLITSGSQQGLDLVGKVLLDPGDTVLVENPSYLGALQAFGAHQARFIGVPSDADGLRPDELRCTLENMPQRPKFIYLIPNFQNPTGTSLSAARRAEIVDLAADFGVPIVEDDPYGRLRYSGMELPALGALPGAHDWIYLGTLSKVLSPGMRLAWMATSNRELLEQLISAKQATDLHTSSFTQQLVWRYLRRPGALPEHVEKLRAAYGSRRDSMLSALERHLPPECGWTRPDGGLFLWVQVPARIDAAGLLREAMRLKVAFVPGEPFWVGPAARNTLRLNFSNATEEAIEEGVRRLADALSSI